MIVSGKSLWARLGRDLDTGFDGKSEMWSIHVVVDEETSQQWVEDKKATKMKTSELDGEEVHCVVIRKDTKWKKSGDEKKPVVVVDNYGKALDPNEVGNGSKINVQYSTRDWEFNGRTGTKCELIAVQVVELVKYEGKGDKDEFSFMTDDD